MRIATTILHAYEIFRRLLLLSDEQELICAVCDYEIVSKRKIVIQC